MCQYSAENGMANDWHFVHLGSRAVGGAGLVMVEATAVTPDGRISPADLGIWSDQQASALERIASFISAQGAVPGIQIAHAGRKASTEVPWRGHQALSRDTGGWEPVLAPSAIAFRDDMPVPVPLDHAGIRAIVQAFGDGARRARTAGFRVVEIHAAHGYLIHEFLSPLANRRSDEYGGSFDNRTRFLREIVAAVRGEWADDLPLFVRISATDWTPGGWDIEQSVELARTLRPLGVDLFDCSSGGIVSGVRIQLSPGYQADFARRIREDTGMRTAAVGLITEPAHADSLVREGAADVVLLAREMLRDPYWPLHAAKRLGVKIDWPAQYLRAVD